MKPKHAACCRRTPAVDRHATKTARALAFIAAALQIAAPVGAKDPPAAPVAAVAGKPQPAAAYRTVGWDELLPADWEPAAEFKSVDLGKLSDNDPRAAKMFKRLREIWDNAPANPALQGSALRIAGYVVPLEETPQGMLEFLLVPHFGACIHTPPPPANQIIHVRSAKPVRGLASMDAIWISGTMKTARAGTTMGVSGYAMDVARIEPYSRQQR